MEKNIVRLVQLEICNIKNVAYGKIDFSTGAVGRKGIGVKVTGGW